MPTLADLIQKYTCDNCKEEITGYNVTASALPTNGGQGIKVTILSCPKCKHVAYTLLDVNVTQQLVARISALEQIVGSRNH